jgi:phosphoribosylamine---glycine ligase
MKLLVIGSGGREHALVWKLAQSARVTEVWCAPGNGGMGAERLRANGAAVECVPIGAEDIGRLLDFARGRRPDLTVVGPDNPLALGVVDSFEAAGLRIWGPNRRAARFESSKAFAQGFMERHGIPTMRAGVFDEFGAASRFAAELGGRCAVKADGLALGKGVFICRDMAQADDAIRAVLVERRFGEAGARVVMQELLEGQEVSLHALCDGRTTRLFPASQDHKRVYEGDRGPNTGGMGAYCPAPFLAAGDLEREGRRILEPWLAGCRAEGIDYRGVLYPGVMLTPAGMKVLEFNARFGDPETQVYLTRLESDLVELLWACVEGTLDRTLVRWRPGASVCVVMAAEGYPGRYVKGTPIAGLEGLEGRSDCKVFHAGTVRSGDGVFTNGGRVLGVTGWGEDLRAAREVAYEAVAQIRFAGAHFRGDIGEKGLR